MLSEQKQITFIKTLRTMAVRSLARMYCPEKQLFVFRVRRDSQQKLVTEGLSHRYTAITLIGLAQEPEETIATVLHGEMLEAICTRLLQDLSQMANLGDVALALWAAHAIGHPDRGAVWARLAELRPAEETHPTVEVAWSLTALCLAQDLPAEQLRARLAQRLLSSCGAHSSVFPHLLGGNGAGLRSHVSCFADLVYPVQALALYSECSENQEALEVALRCARLFCRQQGESGQWWWHYDWRTGEVLERYPVYAVHQDAMAPMALLALEEASGEDFSAAIVKGLTWLARAPELNGGSLIDQDADLIWRKVARREPRKLARSLQAAASRVHPQLRAPGLDRLFPVGAIDYEDRPYHLGWLLYAWPAERIAAWESRGTG